jgi:hypothetical protein
MANGGAAGHGGNGSPTTAGGGVGVTAGTSVQDASDSVPPGTGGTINEAGPVVDAASAADRRPTDCPAGALICDDFESYALGGNLSPNWTTQLMNGKVEIETSRPFHGAKGLRMTTTLSPANEPPRTNGGPLRAAVLVKEGAPLFPAPANSFFGRAMIWLTKMPPGGVHFSNIEASGKLADGTLAKYGQGGMYENLMAGYTIRPKTELDLPTIDCSKSATTGIPEKRWVCVEWQFDGTNDEMRLWFDGALQTGVEVVKQAGGCAVPWKAPTFDKLYLGWRHSQPSPIDVEMWLDDVVIHTSRVGCPAP